MNQLYTTSEAAKATGIPEGTIRAWLSRYSEVFLPDVHLVIENGKKFWTQKGIELLQSRRATEKATPFTANGDAVTTEDAISSAANNDAAVPPHVAILESYLDATASSLATTFWQQLPGRTLQHIQRIANSPLPQESETLHRSVRQVLQLLPSTEGKYQALLQAENGLSQ